MNATAQFEMLMGVIRDIRDRLPEPPQAVVNVGGKPPALPREEPVTALRGSDLATIKRGALLAVLDALDGWIEGCNENHRAMEHRTENRGEECWRQFAPSDFRNMVNDACREIGIAPFPTPARPREDTVRR